MNLAGIALVILVSTRLHLTVRAGLAPFTVPFPWLEAAAVVLIIAGICWLIARSWRGFPHLAAAAVIA